MLREVVHTDDIERQKIYLVRVYKWFFAKMSSIGAVNTDEKQRDDEFMNPEKYQEKEKKLQEDIERKRKILQSQEYATRTEKGWFDAGERTIHKDIMPARERIEFYKRKLPKDPNQSMGEISTRPATNSSSTRVKTAKTRADTVYGQSFRPSFNTFYTTGEEVKYNNLIKVESKSSYVNYVPSDNIVEQKLEKMWRETKNKELAEKRCNDEIQQTLKEWGDAKSRYEEDVNRKNECIWYGSTVIKYERKTKKKNIDLHRNHLEDEDGSSLMSDSELEEKENEDQDDLDGVGEDQDYNKKNKHLNVGETVEITNSKKRPETTQNQIRIRKQSRARTAGRATKKQPIKIPKLIDSSKEAETKLVFANIDPVGAQALIDLQNPKLKTKTTLGATKPVPSAPSIRPKTCSAGQRRIEMLRRFHSGLINSTSGYMPTQPDQLDNIFISHSGQDALASVVSLSI